MSKYAAYFSMNEADVVEYVLSEFPFFPNDAQLSCKEIGDGNLNYVFRVKDAVSGRSIIVKQAGPRARISEDIEVSPDRNRIESEIMQIQHKLAPGLVPEMYHFDVVMNCCIMEDLSDHEVMRNALLAYKRFPLFAEHITTFLANTLLLTSDVVMNHKDKKELVKQFINVDLCEISEELVYTEPFYDCERNQVFPETKPLAKSLFWDDKAFLLETAKLKFEFMNHAQSLIHGDLHTGSIFVHPDSTKVFDAEFAFYGPAGYDVGNVIANLIFAYVYTEFTMATGPEQDEQKAWLTSSIEQVVDLFKEKFSALWDERAAERVAQYDGFKAYYLDGILRDTAAVAGLELARRILGLAQVKDITSISDPALRFRAEKFCLTIAKEFIMKREAFTEGKHYTSRLSTL